MLRRKKISKKRRIEREYFRRLDAAIKKNNDLDIPVDEQMICTRVKSRQIKLEMRRKKAENICLRARTIVPALLMFSVSLFLIFGKRPVVSTEENRNLAEFPEFSVDAYLSGEYTSDIAAFFNDTVPLRSTFKSMISGINSLKGINSEEGAVLIGSGAKKDPDNNDISESEPSIETLSDETTAAETETITEINTADETETYYDSGEIDNNILIWNKRALMLYGGSFSRGEQYAAALNSFRQQLGDDINIYSMVIPTAGTFYLPEKYKSLANSETENIDHINEYLDNSIIPVDAYSALYDHKKEKIYARTDHHWLPLGAFYAAEKFADTAGADFAPLDSYEKVIKEGYVGTMYGYTNGSEILKNNPEDFIYYIPSNKYETTYYDSDMTNEREGELLISLDNVDPVSWYLVFMGSDDRITHISTDCKNNRTLVIIKDSYGNAIVPCLTSSFSEIYVVDLRYFEPNIIDFINDVGADDLLFAMDTYSATGINCDHLDRILDN